MFKHLTVILAFLMTLSSPVVAQDFQKGFAAYNAGDYATALQEWTPLAEAGDAPAQFHLGRMLYIRCIRVDCGNFKEAVKWYRLAAELGSAWAQATLGGMYERGRGVPQDNAIAHMWYNIGAANG